MKYVLVFGLIAFFAFASGRQVVLTSGEEFEKYVAYVNETLMSDAEIGFLPYKLLKADALTIDGNIRVVDGDLLNLKTNEVHYCDVIIPRLKVENCINTI